LLVGVSEADRKWVCGFPHKTPDPPGVPWRGLLVEAKHVGGFENDLMNEL
jgi:hypothetical protein